MFALTMISDHSDHPVAIHESHRFFSSIQRTAGWHIQSLIIHPRGYLEEIMIGIRIGLLELIVIFVAIVLIIAVLRKRS